MEFELGSIVGDYQIIDVLGAGGMGKVYKVRNLIADRFDALKVLLPTLDRDPEPAERFLNEIRLLARLDHCNIVQLRTAMRLDRQILMVMEFIDGVTFDKSALTCPIPVPEAIDAVSQVLAALEFAHKKGVIHRDIKPANIIRTSAGVVKLMDFGIAKAATDLKMTATGMTLGSVNYMSPEQIRANPVDGRSDLYSLGVTLYQLVTAKLPFNGNSEYEVMAAHLSQAPLAPIFVNPSLPQVLNDIILRAVAKDLNDRYQSAEAFRDALSAVAEALKENTERARPIEADKVLTRRDESGAPPSADQRANRLTAKPCEPKSRRWLWVSIGGFTAAVALFGLVEFGPRRGAQAGSPGNQPESRALSAPTSRSPGASGEPEAVRQTAQIPSESPGSVSVPQTRAGIVPAATGPTVPPSRRRSVVIDNPLPPTEPGTSTAPLPQVSLGQPQPPAAGLQGSPTSQATPSIPTNNTELKQARDQLILITANAVGVRSFVESLRADQAKQGYGLRSDIEETVTLLDTYLKAAGAALASGDVDGLRDAVARAAEQVQQFDKLTGRPRK